MAKNSIRDYDSSSSNNSDVQSVDISEGCSPSGINNAIREVMADLADVNEGTVALESPKFDSIKDGNIKPPDASGTDVAGTATTIKGGAGTGTGAGGSIVFQTADGGSTGSSVNAHATAMTITDDGNVGIGTTSPATATGGGIDIEKAGGASVRLDDTTNSVTGELQVYSAGMKLATITSKDLILSTNNTQRMRIEADGDRIFYGAGASTRNAQITGNGQLVGGIGAVTTSGTTNWNDATNARSGSGYTLLAGNATNGMGGSAFYHPFSFEYNSKTGTGNMTQLAIGYNTNARYMRYYYAGSWSSWVSF